MIYLFENIQKELVNLIKQSNQSIKIAVTWFTNHNIFDELMQKLEDEKFNIELIVLNDTINNKKEGINFQKLINKNGTFYFSDVENMVHHKFCIIDDSIVITGSYNWTYYAEHRNWENVIILKDKNIVNGFVEEFERIKQSHKKVKKVAAVKKTEYTTQREYLKSDYLFQGRQEEERGNDLTAAKIYTEILRLYSNEKEVIGYRTNILKKLNYQSFITCPFEIGIKYANGYSMVIPEFSPLPITKVSKSISSEDNQTSVEFTIQKRDCFRTTTILTVSLNNIYVTRKEKQEFESTLTIDTNGILTVTTKEVNGYGRKAIDRVDLKK